MDHDLLQMDTIVSVEPRAWAAMRSAVELWAAGRFAKPDVAAAAGFGARASRTVTGDGVAVIPIMGFISQRPNLLSFLFGGTTTGEVAAGVRQAVADPAVTTVVLLVDSPGGSVFGVEELAAVVAQVRTLKPVIAVVEGLMASAAYWIGAAASEVIASPSSELGSIGVASVHEDLSKLQERLGIKTTVIHAGARKADGSPFAPLSDRARADLQARVDTYYDLFVTRVASGRGLSADRVRALGARVVGARDAVRVGLANRMGTLDQVLAGAARRAGAADTEFRLRRARAFARASDSPQSRRLEADLTARLRRTRVAAGDVERRKRRARALGVRL